MSNLELNDQIVPFKDFYGANHKEMPKLIAEGRVPLLSAGLMQERLNSLGTSTQDAWWNNYFETGDGIFYHPEGSAKIVLGAQIIKDLTPNSPLSNGAIVLGDSIDESIAVYKSLDAVEEFSKKDIENLKLRSVLSPEEAKNHPVWIALAGGDKILLNNYVDETFRLGKEQYSKEKMMDVYFGSAQKKAVGRLWCVGSLGYGSSASGNYSVDGRSGGRFVGVAPEALGARGNTPSISTITNNVHAYLKNTDVVEGATKKGITKAIQDSYK